MVSLDALVMLEQIEFYAKKLVNALVFKDAVDQNNFFGLSSITQSQRGCARFLRSVATPLITLISSSIELFTWLLDWDHIFRKMNTIFRMSLWKKKRSFQWGTFILNKDNFPKRFTFFRTKVQGSHHNIIRKENNMMMNDVQRSQLTPMPVHAKQ